MNQALMDLGATICLPNGAPLCDKCPWQMHCAARRTGKEQQLPVKEEKKQRRKEKRTVLRIRLGDRVVIGKRPERGLLANLYELPNAEGWLTEVQAEEACRTLGYEPKAIRKLKPSKHIFSHVEWHMHAFEIEAEERPDASAAENGFLRRRRVPCRKSIPFQRRLRRIWTSDSGRRFLRGFCRGCEPVGAELWYNRQQ
ncbi:MAG: NUDIX domain-containing protein, partial [Clostridia bacterium]|nr:NUDIX domain-containing protein [Clostridia bacterium]